MDWGSGITYLGEASVKGKTVRFGIYDRDRLERMTVVARPQTRASFFVGLALQDAERGLGTVIIDPGGEFSELFIERVPPEIRERVIYLDPSEAEYPFSWNPLEDYRTLPREEGLASLSLLLSSLYKAPASPLTEWVAERMLTDRQATLLLLYELVAEPQLRDKMLPPSAPERAAFDALLKQEEETVSAIRTNGRYLAKDTLVRNILGQEHSKFRLSSLKEGAIIVLNVSRIRMFPTRITPLVRLFSYVTRALAAPGAPHALYLYDCLRTFSEDDADYVFSDRALAITLADALPSTDDREWRKRVLATSGSVVAFSPNPNDVAFVEELFFPFVAADEFERLEPNECALMLSIDSLRSKPFFARSLALRGRSGVSYQDIQVSGRERHAAPRHVVDQSFQKKYAAPLPPRKDGEPAAFSSAFRSIFSKNAAGAQPPPRPAAPPAPSSGAPVPPSQKADINKKPAEVSEDELRDMLHVDPPTPQ